MQNGDWYNMEYHFNLPIDDMEIKKLKIGDIIYLTGIFFTARDEAHHIMINSDKKSIQFDPSKMALFHCGPLMKKTQNHWHEIDAGTSIGSRLELFEADLLEKFPLIQVIIGKGGMGKDTLTALHNKGVYLSYTGGAAALAADQISTVKDVFWLEELGMAEAIWIFEVTSFGPLVVGMDAHGHSLFHKE